MINPFKRIFTAVLAGIMLSTASLCGSLITLRAGAAETMEGMKDYQIINPYESVNWASYGQYKANFHAHTTESLDDGVSSPKDMIEDHYKKGYDILAITDHDFLSTTWNRKDRNPYNYLSDERLNEINTGIDRNGRGMIGVPFSNEQSIPAHLNTFWANFNNEAGATLESNIAKCEELGGISHINHPGGAAKMHFEDSEIKGFVNLYLKYPSCVGMEILNKRYANLEIWRVLWDKVLMNTMPERPVWGFSNDDTHYVYQTGYNFNLMLMPKNTEESIRYSMENGTFYAVALFAKSLYGEEFEAPDSFPVINNIEVHQEENSITITGENYDVIEWVADNKIIATGHSIDLNNYEDMVNSYIRAQLKGPGGLSFTQPFGIIEKTYTKFGDINGDKVINSTDFVLLKRHILSMDGYILNGESLLAADVDGSGKLDSLDLVYMRRYILRMITNFPAVQIG